MGSGDTIYSLLQFSEGNTFNNIIFCFLIEKLIIVKIVKNIKLQKMNKIYYYLLQINITLFILI